MFCLYLLLFFSVLGILIFVLVRYLDEQNPNTFADEISRKRQSDMDEIIALQKKYKKHKQEDITDL